MKRKIVWEKWNNPFQDDNINDIGHSIDDINDEYMQLEQPEKMMQTPFGIITAINNKFADREFDFWVLHTNFNITNKIASFINQTDGVETLEVYTRYRARIGFPKSGLFDVDEIKKKIEEELCSLDEQKILNMLCGVDIKSANQVKNRCKELHNKFDNWSLWMLPNGNIEAIGSDENDKLYSEKVNIFHYGHQMVGGRMITSTD